MIAVRRRLGGFVVAVSWRALLDRAWARRAYRALRRAKLELWLALEEDRRWLQVVALAMAALVFYLILAW